MRPNKYIIIIKIYININVTLPYEEYKEHQKKSRDQSRGSEQHSEQVPMTTNL